MLGCLLVEGKGDNKFSLTATRIEHCESDGTASQKLNELSSGFCWSLSLMFADEDMVTSKSELLSLKFLSLWPTEYQVISESFGHQKVVVLIINPNLPLYSQ